MHRSGSSLVAQILHAAGFALGPRLLDGSEFNPDGHFEDRFVLSVNKRLPIHFGGTWDRPPALPSDWLGNAKVRGLLERAREYQRQVIAPTPRFVFKEPRTSLLLPFWRRAFGEMTCVVVLRSPASVARSVVRRNREWRQVSRLGWRLRRAVGNWWIGEHERLRPIDEGQALALWHHYYESIARDTAGLAVVPVVYERLVCEPHREIPRLLRSVGGAASVPPEVVKPSLDHGKDLRESDEVRSYLSRFGEARPQP
jgi:hypothetical protein